MDILVRQNDTFNRYSKLFSVPLLLIVDSNPNVNPNQLNIGQVVKIPGYVAWTYTVQQGDTYWTIHRRFNVPLDALLFINPLIQPNQLTAGMMIRIPSRVENQPNSRAMNYSYAELERDIEELKSKYPFMTVSEVGRSVEGRQLTMIKIGTGSNRVQWNASFHANEWITTPILVSLLDDHLWHLTNSDSSEHQRRMATYEQTSLYVIPMVNPDGVELVINGPSEDNEQKVVAINNGSHDFTGWKANIEGVDLNDQFPAGWEIEKESNNVSAPAPRDYPGVAPLNQPESQAMAELARQIPFNLVIALHTQGEEFYWGYEGLEPPISQRYASLFSASSGYRSVRYVDSHAGYKDWFIYEFRKPGFTFELGSGVNPLHLDQFPEIYAAMAPVFIQSVELLGSD